ncbi:hypothetical protein HB779_15305 [Phyllobacterium sp. 628]|uniref:HdeA/HdeB family chaperone n=1 Tax=Phyllobacterium sp. 628 TaxID=2718938 RepID=UPI0016623CA0|nr:hypothetical protein [Phyllobacterium sp. 628]QND53116.1 hypothetical protein HB779_15305 [Phyllobacterium sp. 628]
MRLILIAATSLPLIWSFPAGAKTQFGPGAVTCQTFLYSFGKRHILGQGYRDWIAGFISGFNETQPGPDVLKEGHEEEYFKAVEEKCMAIPDQPLSDAIIDLELELNKKLLE